MIFKQLEWKETKNIHGIKIVSAKAEVSIEIGEFKIHTLFSICEDNAGVFWLGAFGDFKESPQQMCVRDIENGKRTADLIYQKKMNELHKKISELII